MLIILIIAFTIIATNHYEVAKTIADRIGPKLQLLSAISSTIMTFVTIVGIFIAFSYENKLMNASKILRQIYRPYGITIDEWRLSLINYGKYLSGDTILKLIYPLLLLICFSTIIVWGLLIGFYTQFVNPFKVSITLEDTINIATYLMGFVLVLVLVSITAAVNLIRMSKDPLGKGFLPKNELIYDVDYLVKQDADLDEIFLNNSPALLFYKNPPLTHPKYELKFELPVKLANYRFVSKISLADGTPILKCYGILKTVNNMGERFHKTICDNLAEELFLTVHKEDVWGELKIFDDNMKVIARLVLEKKIVQNGSSFKIVAERIIEQRDSIELEQGLLKNIKEVDAEILKMEPSYRPMNY